MAEELTPQEFADLMKRELSRLQPQESEDIAIVRTPNGFSMIVRAVEPESVVAEGESYNGYFKVTNTSDESDQKITVNAGIAQINEEIYSVSGEEETVTTTGMLILKATTSAVTIEKVSSLTYTAGQSKTILCTYVITDGVITELKQQQHGMVFGLIFGDCDEV